MKATSFLSTVLLTGAIGLVATPVFSQSQMDKPPITKEPSQTPPGAANKGTLKLSKQDVHQLQQALERKGYNAGTSGALDEKTKDAIRAFQKDNNLPITGSLDTRTASELGIELHNQSSTHEYGTPSRMR
jgi:peptidoglycan hydrolase-like protein with peptidoglycan-binding domain